MYVQSETKNTPADRGLGGGDVTKLLANAHQALTKLPAQILELGEVFTDAGYEIALVGGPVRDAFLAQPAHDFDLTTSARPDDTQALLEKWADAVWSVGKAFGTIGARRGDLMVEVTTYRTEEYQGNSRKPQVAYGDNLEGDLSRRDFTVNACALILPSMKLVDPFGGLEDLARGELHTPVSARQSFDDDPLRIMRAARFSAQLGIDVSMEVMEAMEQMAPRLKIVSAERIRTELERLIISDFPRRGLELMVHTGVCDLVLPELSNLQDTKDEHNRHKDVYEHTLTVLDQAMALETDADGAVPAPDFVLRFAALMHDVGKPATRKFEPDGSVSFHQHDLVGAKMTKKRMRALKFDNQTIHDVAKLVRLHLRFHGYGEQAWTDAAVRRYVTDAGEVLERLHRLTRADCTTRNRRKFEYLRAAYDDLESRIETLREQEALDAIRPDLDGQQIMDLLGLKPGKEVGRARQYLLDLRMEQGPLGPERAREELLSWWAGQTQEEQLRSKEATDE
ncbi:MAG: CCA tRNA nucleotidyltransferase [Actinomycetaceae bacterium]|nr:CCA tRNA nucleotidyltransferase [Actinomycetaceae bacterium]